VLLELISVEVLEKVFTPNPGVEEAPSIPRPKGELGFCPYELVVCPKAEPVRPIEGALDWNYGDD
jgi:hypothetical protein